MMERRIINPWSWQDKYGFVQANDISGATSYIEKCTIIILLRLS
jgi:hypothetical protein